MRQSRIREALGKIYDQHPPQLREQIRRLQEDPKSRVFAPLAENYRRLGNVEQAIEVCKKGLEHHPDYPSGRLALAKCYIDTKKFEDAKRELERVIQLSPENLLAHRLLADMLLSLEDRKGAIHHYKMALLLAPEDVALHEKIRGIESSLENLPSLEEQVINEDVDEEETVTVAPSAPVAVDETGAIGALLEKDEDEFQVSEPLWVENQTVYVEEEETDQNTKSQINKLLGLAENDDEEASFKSEPFRHAFIEKERERNKEITTETLANLYLGQGQVQEALEMLERLYKKEPSAPLLKKIQECRVKLGVDADSLLRQRQIEVLRGVLRRQHSTNEKTNT